MGLPLLEPCNHLFSRNEFGTKAKLLADLGHGEDPVAVMLTCWELGNAPDQISHANPGELIIVQNAAGLTTKSANPGDDTALDAIIYGIRQPSVRHLIVCGHTTCTMLRLIIEEIKDGKKNPFHEQMQSVSERFESTYRSWPEHKWQGIFVQEAVVQQIANLRACSAIRSTLQERPIIMHGWVRNDQTSHIAEYDPRTGQFA